MNLVFLSPVFRWRLYKENAKKKVLTHWRHIKVDIIDSVSPVVVFGDDNGPDQGSSHVISSAASSAIKKLLSHGLNTRQARYFVWSADTWLGSLLFIMRETKGAYRHTF